MKYRLRAKTGSMLVLIICTIAVVFLPVLVIFRFAPFMLESGGAVNLVEAAGLTAASELARIIIPSRKFGYVSLSNHPPSGKAVLAEDGQPLPVTSINTIAGCLRQNAILAEELDSQTMRDLLDDDLTDLQETIITINATLKTALLQSGEKSKCIDIDGKKVDPYRSAHDFLKANLPPHIKITSLTLSLGWLEGGSESAVALPRPISLARIKAEEADRDTYKAFTDFPVGRHSFTFAGLDNQAHLVSSRSFRPADDQHICSIVKIECAFVSSSESDSKILSVACCQPYCKRDSSICGAMTVRFSGRPSPGLLSWRELLNEHHFSDGKTTVYDVNGGDYPFHKEAQLRRYEIDQQTSVPALFAERLYSWLRNTRTRPRIDSVLSMINEPFNTRPNQIYIFSVNDDGSIGRDSCDAGSFLRSVVAEGQFAAMSDTRIRTGQRAIVLFKDSVWYPNRGKHAGQPLAGYPLRKLSSYVDYKELADHFSLRAHYDSGLAVDIEISGTQESTAMLDVSSMRKRTAHRKI